MPDLQDRSSVMDTPPRTVMEENRRRQDVVSSAQAVMGGFSAEAIAGAAGLVLAILALVIPTTTYLAPIATIVLGAAFLLAGLAIASCYHQLARETGEGRGAATELGAGLSAELIGGVAAVVLGILALIQLSPLVLLEVSAIVLGATLLLGSGSTARMANIRAGAPWPTYDTQQPARRATTGDAGLEVLVGIAAIVLGILALVGIGDQMILVCVALVVVGAQALLSGLVLTGRMEAFLRYRRF